MVFPSRERNVVVLSNRDWLNLCSRTLGGWPLSIPGKPWEVRH